MKTWIELRVGQSGPFAGPPSGLVQRCRPRRVGDGASFGLWELRPAGRAGDRAARGFERRNAYVRADHSAFALVGPLGPPLSGAGRQYALRHNAASPRKWKDADRTSFREGPYAGLFATDHRFAQEGDDGGRSSKKTSVQGRIPGASPSTPPGFRQQTAPDRLCLGPDDPPQRHLPSAARPCTIACQAENTSPSWARKQVIRGLVDALESGSTATHEGESSRNEPHGSTTSPSLAMHCADGTLARWWSPSPASEPRQRGRLT